MNADLQRPCHSLNGCARDPDSNSTSAHARFVVDNVALREISLRVLPFSFVNTIPPMLHTYLYPNNTLRTSGRSLGTLKQGNALSDTTEHYTKKGSVRLNAKLADGI